MSFLPSVPDKSSLSIQREFTIGGTKITLVPATGGMDTLATLHIADIDTNDADYKKFYAKSDAPEGGMLEYRFYLQEAIRARLNGACLMSRSPKPYNEITLSHAILFPEPRGSQTEDSVIYPPDEIEKARGKALPLLAQLLAGIEKKIPDAAALHRASFNMDPMVARMLSSRATNDLSFVQQASTHRFANAFLELERAAQAQDTSPNHEPVRRAFPGR